MSEYKVGDKVLIEAEIVGKDKETYCVKADINDANSIWIEKDEARKFILKNNKTYEDGLREAWELARRISSGKEHGGFDLDELEEIFKASTRAKVFREFTPQKAAECVALWEARQNIQVQDQVRYRDTNHIGVVMKVIGQDNDIEYYVLWGSGISSYERANDLTKTGRTIDIAGLLAQIGGAE